MHLLLRSSANVGDGHSETQMPVALSAYPLGQAVKQRLVSLNA